MPRHRSAITETVPAGIEQPWPQTMRSLVQGEVGLMAELLDRDGTVLLRRPIVFFEAPCPLPGRGEPPFCLRLHLRVIRAARFGTAHPADRTGTTVPAPEVPAFDAAAIEAHLRQDLAEQEARNAAFVPLDDRARQRQFLSFEAVADPGSTEPGDSGGDGNAAPDPLLAIVACLCRRHGTTLRQPRAAPGDPRQRLELLLERSGLIGRAIRASRADLRRDCGDLVVLRNGEPLLLLSTPGGYRLWDPSRGGAAPRNGRRLDRRGWAALGEPIEAITVLPAFRSTDLTTEGLLRFAYGPATAQAALILTGTMLGLALGFLLAIGREVGASRWIFGIGGLGLLGGAGLAVLGNGFRPALLAAFLSTLLGLLTPTFNTILTNQALPEKDAALMLQMGALLLAAAVAEIGLGWTRSRTLVAVQQRGAVRMEMASLQRLLSLPIDFFRRYGVGELALRFGAIAELRDEIQSLLSGGVLQLLLSAIFLLFMMRISVKLTLLAVVVALLLLLPTAWLGRQSRDLERQREQALAEATGRNLELIGSVSKLRLAGAEAAAARHWGAPYREAIGFAFALDARAAVSALLQAVIPNLGTLLLFITITRLAAEAAVDPNLNAPNIGELLGFLSAFGTFIGAMASAASLAVGAFDLPVLYERARPILDAAPEATADSLDPGPLQGALAVENVRFRYGPDGPWVLDGVSFSAAPGEFIAVVGASGSGKSTLVRLLLGLARPETGVIRYDGMDLATLRPEVVRRQVGAVTQNAALFAGSLLEAIAGGAVISLEEAWEAAAAVALADEIRALPMGMQTVVPEGGGTLSGGQRQRVAIARALVRRPRLLIFDEATSALDNRTQAQVSEHLAALAVTRIVVAHRLSTIRRADRVIVLEGGRVVQQGGVSELIAQPGPFAALMRRQLPAEPEDRP